MALEKMSAEPDRERDSGVDTEKMLKLAQKMKDHTLSESERSALQELGNRYYADNKERSEDLYSSGVNDDRVLIPVLVAGKETGFYAVGVATKADTTFQFDTFWTEDDRESWEEANEEVQIF